MEEEGRKRKGEGEEEDVGKMLSHNQTIIKPLSRPQFGRGYAHR